MQEDLAGPAARVGNLQEVEHAGDADDAAHDVVAERFDEVEHELRLARLEPTDELVDVVANREDRGLVAALGETVRNLLHGDVGLFFVRLEIRENGDIHTVVSAR